MAVEALQLRPRGAVALVDAAVRVCATSAGVWALTLPAGAAVLGALFFLAEAIRHHRPVALPAALLTAAWSFRALSQGAACHHLEQALLAPAVPRLRASWRAALGRAPGLITASVVMVGIDLALWGLTLGLGFFFLGAHQAGLAAVMRGQGSALRVYGTSARLLGPARAVAPWVRVLGLTQLLLAVNLQLAVMGALALARELLGLQVTFLQRLTSPTDAVWLAVVLAFTFALFEPLRAATATLLLLDGRVRQEGLDLLALVEQLPRRARGRTGAGAGAGLVALALVLASPGAAAATPEQRLRAVEARCELDPPVPLEPLARVRPGEEAALERFVARLERAAEDEEACEAVAEDLAAGLRALDGPPAPPAPVRDPAELAREILARPEFQDVPPPEEEPPGEQGWWEALMARLRAWLDRALRNRGPEPVARPAGNPLPAADLVIALALAGAVAVLVLIGARLWAARQAARGMGAAPEAAGEESALPVDPASALSRPPRGWAELADQLAARGEFREAIRHLYLALLARLHREGLITYEPTQSNWEHLRAFRGPPGDRGVFRELTLRFDYAWYGHQDHGQASWEHFRRTARPLLDRPEAG